LAVASNARRSNSRASGHLSKVAAWTTSCVTFWVAAWARRASLRPRGGNYNDEAIRRGRESLDDILSGDTRTRSGNAADDLLDSVNRRLGY
jgi:hypothetical protein